MDRSGGVCARARIALSSKPVLPIFALFISMVAFGCCICGLFGDYWMKNTTNYIDAKSLFLSGYDAQCLELDATIHVNPKWMWLQITYQRTYDDQPVDLPEISFYFAAVRDKIPQAASYANASNTVMALMYASTCVVGVVVIMIIALCVLVIANKTCPPMMKSLLVFLSFVSAVLPTASVCWWSVTVPNPADLAMVVAGSQVSMTVDGDMGWSAVLPVLGGCSMLLAVFCLSVYLPPRPQAPLDAALNYDAYQQMISEQVVSEDAGDGSVEGFSG